MHLVISFNAVQRQIQQQFTALRQQMEEIIALLGEILNELISLPISPFFVKWTITNLWVNYRSQRLLPIRLHNCAVSAHAPLRYPVGLAANGAVPLTRHCLFEMTGKFSLLQVVPLNLINVLRSIVLQCEAAATALGLPGLPAATHVRERRAQIADHLGVQP